ncbi:MAG: TonB family protein [Gemmatimonadota bacterium]|nr:TonB family protein [Gemmatimonadota bacterium]
MTTHLTHVQETANDRFKRRAATWLPTGISIAVVVHFAVFSLFPRLNATPPAMAAETLAAIELPPEVEIPPPPEQIARPATPRVATVELEEDLTIAPTTFESNPVESLGPPPDVSASAEDRPQFIPYDVAPKLKNRSEVLAALERLYPATLRNAGIGGKVLLWLYIDERGQVQDTRVAETSGYSALDRAARQVASQMEFTPAQNRDRVTAVWLSQPIDFSILTG